MQEGLAQHDAAAVATQAAACAGSQLAGAAVPRSPCAAPRLRLLCLHGFRQSASSLAGRLASLRARLAADAELVAEVPQAGDDVYSGGPLVAPARAAVAALFDALGPARDDYAEGAWSADLRLASVFKTVQLLPGVLDSEVVAPAANVSPSSSPPVPTVAYLVPGQVLVRYA